MRLLFRLFRDEEAATAVEYSVMLALILLAVLAAVGTLGGKTSDLWGSAVSSLQASGM
jgi:pilus assembly protein Flp/PilA